MPSANHNSSIFFWCSPLIAHVVTAIPIRISKKRGGIQAAHPQVDFCTFTKSTLISKSANAMFLLCNVSSLPRQHTSQAVYTQMIHSGSTTFDSARISLLNFLLSVLPRSPSQKTVGRAFKCRAFFEGWPVPCAASSGELLPGDGLFLGETHGDTPASR